jgi:phage terminase large subunit-like protein
MTQWLTPDWLESWRRQPHALRLRLIHELSHHLTPRQRQELAYDWRITGRDEQLPPDGDWTVWLITAGRGFGKTRTGAEWVRMIAESTPSARIALVGPTAADVRDVMVEGESGIRAVAPPWAQPVYEPSKRRLTWPNGAMATTYSADEPDRLRGPQHGFAYCDEVAAWRYPDAWDMLMMGLRLGEQPRVVATTTPRPVALMKTIKEWPGCHITRGRTADNAANLAPTFLTALMAKYEGTRLGRQELDGEELEDNQDALWQRGTLDTYRTREVPQLVRVVVAIDPAITSGSESDETGIVVAGVGIDGRGYVLADLSGRHKPDAWGRVAVGAFGEYKADRIVAEANQGGEMVSHVLRTIDRDVPIRLVHASRGKVARAEPVAALYEQGRVSHVGVMPRLEDQLCTWSHGMASPDRMDALVWALTELMLGKGEVAFG